MVRSFLRLSIPAQSLFFYFTVVLFIGGRSDAYIIPEGDSTPGKGAPGSCWEEDEVRLANEYLSPEKYVQLDAADGIGNEYVCLIAKQTGGNNPDGPAAQKFATNPIAVYNHYNLEDTTEECVLVFDWVQGHENGRARASKACGYKGRCADGNWYNDENAQCLPTDEHYKLIGLK